MNFKVDKKQLKIIKRMKQGHGFFAAILTFPDGGSYKLLFKLENTKYLPLKVYKDGNSLGKRKHLDIFARIIHEIQKYS